MPDPAHSPRTALALLAGAAALVVWTMAPVLPDLTGRFLGTATDAVHHAWGLWWSTQAIGADGLSRVVSYPAGERGALLSPLTVTLVQPWFSLGHAGLAYNAVCAGGLLSASAGVGLLAARLADDGRAGAAAALAMLVGRPLFAHLGMGVTEGMTVGVAALAVWATAGWAWPRTPPSGPAWTRHAASVGVGVLCGVAVVENPYAILLVAPWAGVAAAARGASPGGGVALALAGLGGLAPALGRLWLAGGSLGGNATTAVRFHWAGTTWAALEGEGRLGLSELVWPAPMMDFSGSAGEVLARGGDAYLGMVPLALALAGVVLGGGWARAAAATAALAVALAGGSLPWGQGGPPGPFFFANLALSRWLVALTQPDRYLVFAQAGVAVAAGLGLAVVAARVGPVAWRVAGLALGIEALVIGGPALAIPVTDLRPLSCLAALSVEQGAVMTAAPSSWRAEDVNTAALTLQLLHQRPGTHRGIGGWSAAAPDRAAKAAEEQLDRALQGLSPRGAAVVAAAGALEGAGVTTLLMPIRHTPGWLGGASLSCGGWGAWPMSEVSVKAAAPAARRAGGAR